MLAARHGQPSESSLWRQVSSKMPPSELGVTRFKGSRAPAKPCPVQDCCCHPLPAAATTFHGHTGTSADPPSRIAAVTVHM